VLGNALAGPAAIDDASVVWYNPAAMTLSGGSSVTVSVAAIEPSIYFENAASSGAFASPGTGNGGDGGRFALVPQVYAKTSIGEKWRLGVGFNAPFGLKTSYDEGWRGQLLALSSEVKSYNLNPSVGYRLSPILSLGAGLDIQRFTTELTNFAGPLGNADLKASDTALGFNLGVMVNLTGGARLGIGYRSAISYHLHGSADFSAGQGMFNSGAQAELKVPESASLSSLVPLSPQWELMADITWTRWNRIQQFEVVRTTPCALGAAGSVVAELPFAWSNSTRVALGANYNLVQGWKLRVGVARDPTSTNDVTRGPRLPDEDRTILGIGPQWWVSQRGSLDLAYVHDFVPDAAVHNTIPNVPGALVGQFRVSADILAVQYNQSW
jgi:long-chain fatty acid transport protein